jgi:hypothetical protein
LKKLQRNVMIGCMTDLSTPSNPGAVTSSATPATRWDADLIFDPSAANLDQKRGQQDTCRAIINAIGGVSVLGPPGGVRWRGQADIEWRLDSGATRAGITGTDLEVHEQDMINTARRIGVNNAQHFGDWEVLARYRHNGAATRLIDITTDPFVALFMLCDDVAEKGTDDIDGLLVAVQRENLRPVSKPWLHDSYQRMIDNPTPAAMVIATPPIDPRIAAQRGEFMFSTAPLPEAEAPECELFPVSRPNNWSEDALAKAMGAAQLTGKPGNPRKYFPNLMGIRIPKQAKPRLREMLRVHFGFTRETIYPDWAGIAERFTPSRQ